MADVFSREKRSSIMAANRGSGNRSTEGQLRVRLAAARISGWRMNARDINGWPDFVFEKVKVAVFVDGCFWHGCKKCRSVPATHRSFWTKKIHGNKARDRAVTRRLRKDGWTVIRLWEHQVKRDPKKCLSIIEKALTAALGSGR